MSKKKRVSIIENDIYQAVAPICEGREHQGSYRGNGHHLAQEITKAVSVALLASKERRVYNALTSTPKSSKEIAKEIKDVSKNVSAILSQIYKKTLLVHFKTNGGKLKYWHN